MDEVFLSFLTNDRKQNDNGDPEFPGNDLKTKKQKKREKKKLKKKAVQSKEVRMILYYNHLSRLPAFSVFVNRS